MLGGIGIASSAQFIGMCFMPESPRWLGKEGRSEDQLRVMQKIYRYDHLDAANKDLTAEVKSLRAQTRLSEMQRIKQLCTIYGKCLLIGCTIMAF